MTTTHRPRTREASAYDTAPGPRTRRAFEELRYAIFSEGALDPLTKQLIAVAVAHTTGCQCCVSGHTVLATRAGATPLDLTEAIWVARCRGARRRYLRSSHGGVPLRPGLCGNQPASGLTDVPSGVVTPDG
jgi:AhpD family alkylhydroperoxidase